jgi:hypothetical protein
MFNEVFRRIFKRSDFKNSWKISIQSANADRQIMINIFVGKFVQTKIFPFHGPNA